MSGKEKFIFGIILILIAIIAAGIIALSYGNEITVNLNGTDFTVPTKAGNDTYNMVKKNDSTLTVNDTNENANTSANTSKSLVIHTTNSYNDALIAARNSSGQYKSISGQAIPNETQQTKIANVTVTKIKLNYGDKDFYYYFTKDNKHFYMFGYPEQWNATVINGLLS